MMGIADRALAVRRAKRALKALAAHPNTSRRQLEAARDRINDCHRLPDPNAVWAAVADIEDAVAAVYGVPCDDEPAPRAVSKWVSPRGNPRPAKPRRPRRPPGYPLP